MAIFTKTNYVVVRDENCGAGCEIRLRMKSPGAEMSIVFVRNGGEVFSTQVCENIIDTANNVFNIAEADIFDFLNAEVGTNEFGAVIETIREFMSEGLLKYEADDKRKVLVKTVEDLNGVMYYVLRTFRGKEVFRIRFDGPLIYMDDEKVCQMVSDLGEYFDAFVSAKFEHKREIHFYVEEQLLRYEKRRRSRVST